MKTISSLIRKDILGGVSSALCVIHCLAAPFLIGFSQLGILGVLGTSEWTHRVLLVISIAIAMVVIPASYRVHGRIGPCVLVTTGLTIMIVAMLFEQAALPLTIFGAVSVISAHIWNSMNTWAVANES